MFSLTNLPLKRDYCLLGFVFVSRRESHPIYLQYFPKNMCQGERYVVTKGPGWCTGKGTRK